MLSLEDAYSEYTAAVAMRDALRGATPEDYVAAQDMVTSARQVLNDVRQTEAYNRARYGYYLYAKRRYGLI